MAHQPLRQHQIELIDRVRASLRAGHRRVLVQSATGSGKTRTAAEIIRMACNKGTKTLFLAPRRELIAQAASALAKQGVFAGIIMAGEIRTPSADVQVASFDTLHARAVQRHMMAMPDAGLVVVDEAHLSIAESRKTIIAHYANAKIIGLTATPARGDGRGLGEIYDDLVLGWPVARLVDEGFLVEARYIAPTEPDLAAVKLNRDGDYADKYLGGAMDRPQLIGDIVTHWFQHAQHRSTVVFCVNRAHSRHVRDAFIEQGVAAEHVDGETPTGERAAILARVASGETQVLCNVFVASYGLDIPRLDCAVLARPTKNITLYLQTVGRVLRICEGKRDALIIDHAGSVKENGFADDFIPWSLDAVEKVKDRKAKSQKEKKAPKEITCTTCQTVFAGRRDCPGCGAELIHSGKPIPTYDGELVEIERKPSTENRTATWEEKQLFMAGLKAYANETNKRAGWVAHKYRAKFGVWPNDPRVKNVAPMQYSPELRSWITSQNIRFAKSQKVAA